MILQNSKKINDIACCYIKEGKLIELAIIVTLDLEKVKDSIIFLIKGIVQRGHDSSTVYRQ